MAVTILNAAKSSAKQRGHSRTLPYPDLDVPGRLRIGHILTIYGISHSSYYVHAEKGYLPKPDGRVGKRPYWRTETIKAHLQK